jgi:hypothetical protein
MASMNDYCQIIQDTLEGQTPALRNTPRERIDWGGMEAVLELYEASSGEDRENMIRALGRIIEEGKAPSEVIAQVLHFASSLDITQVEPSVQKLRAKRIASTEPIRGALENYFAFRQVQRRPLLAIQPSPAGQQNIP